MTLEPKAVFYIDAGGNQVYMPGLSFDFEQYNGVETIQWGIIHQGHRIGQWCYNSRTQTAELDLIPDISKRNWQVESMPIPCQL